MDKCPNNYYVDGNYRCQSCLDSNGETISACAKDPLSFTVRVYSENYQLMADVIFNRAISLDAASFKRIVKIKTKKKAIKANRYSISTTDSITYTVKFFNSSSLN